MTSEKTDPIRFDGQVAIVTGAGGGLGRQHALQLAERGARLIVNDLGVARDGSGRNSAAAESVAQEIRDAGGVARVSHGSVTDEAAVKDMVALAMSEWGRVDILVNNAGFLKDRTFSKLEIQDFREIIEVHLMGAVICTKAVWEIMKAQRYGRVVMTTSSSGLFGNFGQSNYSAAKMGLVGLMQTLAIEGEKYGIHVNCLAPSAASRMTEGLLTPGQLAMLGPERVSPGLVYLVSKAGPNKKILCAGGGVFSSSAVTLGPGIFAADERAAEMIAGDADRLFDRSADSVPYSGIEQSVGEAKRAMEAAQSPVSG